MKYLKDFQLIVSFFLCPFMIFGFNDGVGQVLRDAFSVFRHEDTICSKMVSELANIISVAESEYLLCPILKVLLKAYP